MRITFVLPKADLSGGVRVVAIYAERLARRGHTVSVVSLPPRTPTLRERFRHVVRRRPLPFDTRPAPSHVDPLPKVGVEHRLLDRYRPVTASDVPDADVVVATWWETAHWVWDLPPSKGVKVQFMQDYEIFGGPRDRVDASCRLPMPRLCVAQWVANLLRDKFNWTDSTVVPNSVDLEKFHAPPRGKQSTPCVGFTYTPFRNKGVDIAIAACGLARKNIPDLRVVAFGSSEVSDSLPLPPGATYHYRAPDAALKDIYASADAWLFGTRIEGFGLPILEAMACRTPVIGTPAGAAPELLSQGGGMLVPAENEVAMAEAIEKVCRMPDPEWRALSDKAYATASRYTWEDATDRFEAALRAAVEKSGNRGSGNPHVAAPAA